MSSFPEDGLEGQISGVGAELRNARERLGWDLASVAQSLRIREPFLEAIESGRVRDLPGNAYAVGFLRAYASALGLDPDETIRRFRAERTEVNCKTTLTFPVPVPERGVPAGAVVLLGIVIAIGAYAVWYHVSGPISPIRPPPSEPAALVQQAGLAPSGKATPGEKVAGSAKARKAAPPATVAAAPAAVSVLALRPASPPISPLDALAAPEAAPSPKRAKPPAVTAAKLPAAAQAFLSSPAPAVVPQTRPTTGMAFPVSSGAAAAPASGTVFLAATADSWIEVRDQEGHVLVSKILRPGESWAIPAGAGPVTMTTGNAGGTEIVANGVASPPLGSSGAVKRDITIDPRQILREGFSTLIPSAAANTPNSPNE